jgi:hypothetical protein
MVFKAFPPLAAAPAGTRNERVCEEVVGRGVDVEAARISLEAASVRGLFEDSSNVPYVFCRFL